MKKILRSLILIFILSFSLFLIGCETVSEYSLMQFALAETIEEFKETYDVNNITEDLEFITTDENNYTYSWSSSNPEVISNTGEVTRQIQNTEVILTVKLYNDTYYVDDTIICIVIKLEGDGHTYDLNNQKSLLSVYDLNEVLENGEYNDYLDVVAYIYFFQKLPSNYLTKSQAKSLGWKGSGNVWVNDQLRGKNIGGDTFKNNEKLLPIVDTNTYIEVDVNCSNGTRGQYRIVYNRYTFDIYYTSNHYGSFTYMIGVLK